MSSPADYFGKAVPEQWNARLAQQVEAGAEGADLLEKMRAADFGLEVELAEGDLYHLAVRGGEMRSVSDADPAPLFTLGLSAAEAERLEAEIGPSPMALLGGVGGMPEFVITPARLTQLREMAGTLRVEVTGDAPWGVTLHFGAGPVPAPTCTVGIPEAEFRGLLSGDLDLQGAFMTGKLALEGDLEVPMKLAMAIMSPE